MNLPAAIDTARLAQNLSAGTALVMQRGVLKTQASTLALLAGATIAETADSYVSDRLVTSGALAALASPFPRFRVAWVPSTSRVALTRPLAGPRPAPAFPTISP